MKKITSFVLLLITSLSLAQIPMHFNTNVTGGANSIPFNSGATLTWRRAQFCIPAGSLIGATPSNLITKVYFQPSSTANIVYPSFTVRLKTGAAAGLVGTTGGQFESGMTQVFQANNFTMTTVANAWYAITLQVPFPYDPTVPLIVDFEHTATGGTGPTVNQSGVHPIAGSNGRMWGDINGATVAGVGTQQFNFGIDVIPAPVCTGAPPASSISTPTAQLCPGTILNLGLNASTYTNSGYSYIWQTSTVSAFGPWTAIPNATAQSVNTPSLSSTQWLSALITCASNNLSYQTNSALMTMAGTTTNSVPYGEDFETGVYANNILPNCSWKTSSPNSVCQTYSIAGSGNRQPYSGSKFGSFKAPTSPNGDYFYTNGIQLEPGITYSASSWYVTDGVVGWTDYSMWLGTNQTVATLTNIASTNAGMMVNNYYKNLSTTFTVPTSGIYYMAMRCRGSGSGYFSFDDVSITAPCSINSPSVTYFGSTSGCIGQSINFTGNGADTYMWNGSVNSQTLSYLITGNANVQLVGTNLSSGCSSTVTIPISANLSPVVGILAQSNNICKGKPTVLTAYGANSYNWTTGANTATIIVSPTVATTYSVVGVNSFGCSSTTSLKLNMKQDASIFALPSSTLICNGESATLTATGAKTYTWASNNTFLTGSSVVVMPTFNNTYTVTGTNDQGCEATSSFKIDVTACAGISELGGVGTGFSLYPNPAQTEITLLFESENSKSITISDLSGKVIFSSNSELTEEHIDINSFTDGIYQITIKSENNPSKTTKFIKQ